MKKKTAVESSVLVEAIQSKIYLIRGQRVMLDRDLAELYGVQTKVLNQAVKRNIKRFPIDFMFELTWDEAKLLRSQFVTLNKLQQENVLRSQNATSKRGAHIKHLPYVFTEQGVAMLSSVLNSDRAIEVNIQIMRVFTRLRQMIESHQELRHKIEEMEKKYDSQFKAVFAAIRQLMSQPDNDPLPNPYKRTKVGFVVNK